MDETAALSGAGESSGMPRSPAQPPPDDHPDRIGCYFIVRRIGWGGFGTVYLGQDEQLDRPVAIKVPRADRFSGPEDLDRFLKEARLAARVKHPGIVTVYQVDRDLDVGWFVVLEYIEGQSLSSLLRDERLIPSRAAELMAKVSEALSYAHEQGLVHRDLKPANILLDRRGEPHVADFGLAVHEAERWPMRGEVAGTPPYMAPEQVRGESHRLDGRTDVWGLGVILYQMLTGQRPFDGSSNDKIFDEILFREPVPPRQRDRTIPRELEWICLKCLSKRMADRYTTASDLADDLRSWLTSGETAGRQGTMPGPPTILAEGKTLSHDEQPATESGISSPVRVRPKGLRAFDDDDRDFFLGLLPGPRYRDGLPESLRFWKLRIEPRERADNFSVGLLCGPSGSGKTSMIRAGLLCRLSAAVIPVYVEASPGATEARLLDALRRESAAPAVGLTLVEVLVGMRSRALVPEGQKVLIVLDQFEQWLHAEADVENTDGELVRALRQCDGTNVQCLVLVRDDFAMAAARLMRALEIPLVEGRNFATVDVFDLAHARKVLKAFGLAYDRRPDGDDAPFDRFLDHAVAELAEDGKVAPVRLALFAQMLKDKPWTPGTLKNVGGLEGIGVTFLEESLAGPAANPEYRLHLPAARRVLQTLLPEGGADIKGHMRSYQELLDASSYARRPRDFDRLLSILGSELRLITPTDPRGFDAGDDPSAESRIGRYYHLTHDYLVLSLRDWLTRKERETISGRAGIRLADRTAEWTARRSRRYLPSWWEWLLFVLFTRGSRRTPAERRLMRAASLYHASRALAVAAAAALMFVLASEWFGSNQARSAVRNIESAETRNVPGLLPTLTPLRRWTDSLLRRVIGFEGGDPRAKVRARLALLPVDPSQGSALVARLLDGDPDEFPVILQSLRKQGDPRALGPDCRKSLQNEQENPDRRLRAGMALAGLLGEGPAASDTALQANAGFLAAHLVEELLTHPDRYNEWLAALHPARAALVSPLEAIFRGTGQTDSARLLAATILARFAGDDRNTLIELLLGADTRQFPVILRALSGFRAEAYEHFGGLIHAAPPAAAKPEDKAAFVERQANAAIALHHWGDSDRLWPLLRHSSDPLLRTYLIDRIPRSSPDSLVLVRHLLEEHDVSVRRALILILGGIPAGQRSPSWAGQATDWLLERYERDPDPGVHSAAEWTLRRWKCDDRIKVADRRLAAEKTAPQRSWFVTGTGQHTMATITGPVTFRIGSADEEPGHERDEMLRTRVIPRSFSIATKEVTAAQFLAFRPRFARFPNEVSPEAECPINVIVWLDACAYCRWLSEQEHIPEDQMCYPPLAEIREGMKPYPDHLSRTGYRLPTEAEMEYACRAGAITSRYYGDDPEMLGRYAWYIRNADGRTWPVGLLLPNDFGLFDALGNLKEWCYDLYRQFPAEGPDRGDNFAISMKADRVARGGSYADRAHVLRAANRYYTRPDTTSHNMGFRIARTVPAAK
jgi:serine/threonine protein kinase/formylglycine-generating enzyme required for sulfatase activity